MYVKLPQLCLILPLGLLSDYIYFLDKHAETRAVRDHLSQVGAPELIFNISTLYVEKSSSIDALSDV